VGPDFFSFIVFEKGLKENKELIKDFIALDELDKKIEKLEKYHNIVFLKDCLVFKKTQ